MFAMIGMLGTLAFCLGSAYALRIAHGPLFMWGKQERRSKMRRTWIYGARVALVGSLMMTVGHTYLAAQVIALASSAFLLIGCMRASRAPSLEDHAAGRWRMMLWPGFFLGFVAFAWIIGMSVSQAQ